jgi:gamma-glutamyltranspeptidase / glutathione hydrolase
LIPARKAVAVLAAVLLATACATAPQATRPARPAGTAAVAMPDAFSAAVAEDVLRRGGHAVDAAVAAAFALAVTYPEAGNLGGGGFMLVLDRGRPAFLDYRETAPARASRDMFLDAGGEVIENASLVGLRAVGIPGTVPGLEAAHRRYGRLAWRELVAPAIALARDGFVVPQQLASRIERVRERFAGRTSFAEHFGSVEAGGHFRQPELATTLERIAEHGAEELRTGETARLVADAMQRGGGLVTAEDLAAYSPVWREPLTASWREYLVVGAPPPSSGGIAVIQLLRMRELLAERFTGLALNSPLYIHLVAEMEKRVFADRAEFLGDPDFAHVPTAELIDEEHLRSRVAAVRPDAISTVEDARARIEALDTTHFSILDADGNAVANTYTLNASFGSGVVVAGFLLNNEMDDFAIKPGVPNFYGVVGGAANAIAPGKRMLSSMAPTFLLRDGRIALVVGTPGGPTILTSVFQTIVDVVDFGMSPAEAVAATRFHHQLLPPDRITYSPCCPLPDPTLRALRELGYRPEPHDSEFGDVQAIWIDAEGRVAAASDPRGRGVSRVLPPR